MFSNVGERQSSFPEVYVPNGILLEAVTVNARTKVKPGGRSSMVLQVARAQRLVSDGTLWGSQAEVDRLVASWMESLGSVQRLWDVEAIAAALSGEGDDTRKPTPLADLIDGEGFRSLGDGLRNALQAAYKKAEDFKQVGTNTCPVPHLTHLDLEAMG
jgi:hypothetical protein